MTRCVQLLVPAVNLKRQHFIIFVQKSVAFSVEAYTDLQANIQPGVNDAFAKDASLAGKFQEWSAN